MKAPRLRLRDLPPEQREAVREMKRQAAAQERARFVAYCRTNGLPEPEPECRFHPEREWRFDFGWREHRVALEVEGGAFTGGRHTRGVGFGEDVHKYSEAAALGWLVIRTLPKHQYDATTLDRLRRALSHSISIATAGDRGDL